MDIPLRFQSDSRHYAFVMTFEVQNIVAFYDGDVRSLNIQAQLKREMHSDDQPLGLYPVVLNLHGKLYRMNNSQEHGATLLPIVDAPIFLRPGVSQFINLSFVISQGYLNILEEYRASQQIQDMSLQIRLWGVTAMIKPRNEVSEVPHYLQSRSSEFDRFEKISTDTYEPQIRIERSAWVDRILPGLGYRHSVLIELPLVRTPAVPETYQKATQALDMARRAFDQEDYRGAIKHAREVLEHLGKSSSDGSGKLTSFCKEYLEPFVGETKSNVVERSLNALRDVINASSHIDPQKPFIVDRAIAVYVIETLALNLRYISSVLA